MPIPVQDSLLVSSEASSEDTQYVHNVIEPVVDALPDPARVRLQIAEFSALHASLWKQISHDSEQLRRLTTIFSFSRFLSEELMRRPEWLLEITDLDRPFTLAVYAERLKAFLQQRGTRSASALDLAFFRRKELLRIVLRDALSAGSLSVIAEELSDLADAILQCALTTVLGELKERYGSPATNDDAGGNRPALFSVIALGKLGARELNYSSDIDLMFLYGANGETRGPEPITNKEFFKKVANEFTSLLSTYTAAGLCYRVDLRLRPEGTLGDVCLPLYAAQDYYSRRARDWELQMLIKARVAAGDEAPGKELLDLLEPYIYSTTLDFSAIEGMSATRERISEKLARKRLRKNELDVKLAPGGIRDIEFLVQCLQRLHGAREASIRHAGTMLALSRLHDEGRLAPTEYSRLVNAYEFLRHLEHRLQFEDDRQTHALPSNPVELERIAKRMPRNEATGEEQIDTPTRLLQLLNQHLENVQGIYDSIVHAQRPLYYAPGNLSSSPEPVPKLAEERPLTGVCVELLESMQHSAPKFAEQLRARGIQRSERPLAGFCEKLLHDPAKLQTLETQPVVANWMVKIFELSPFLSEQLAQHPGLLEELRQLADNPEARPVFEGSVPSLNDIEGLRRFFRREMFRIQAGSICLAEPVFQTLDRTSALAEYVIARAYRIAREQGIEHARTHATSEKPFVEPQSEMMVVALGRLGMREFDLASDADLLFIIPDSEAPRQRFWTRVVEHLIETLTAYSGDGPILSLDTRLRPNGREGMLVQTESKYVEYFTHKAEAWEGIAYMKARGVAGDTERATSFLTELQRVDWRRYGQGGRSLQALRQMRMRLQKEQGSITPLKASGGGYYDADFILMYLRLKGAGMFFKSLNTPERIDVVEKMGHLECADAEFLLRATTFFRALDHAIRLVTGRAEEKLPASQPEREMVAELLQSWTDSHATADTLENELSAVRAKMRNLFETIFAH